MKSDYFIKIEQFCVCHVSIKRFYSHLGRAQGPKVRFTYKVLQSTFDQTGHYSRPCNCRVKKSCLNLCCNRSAHLFWIGGLWKYDNWTMQSFLASGHGVVVSIQVSNAVGPRFESWHFFSFCCFFVRASVVA